MKSRSGETRWADLHNGHVRLPAVLDAAAPFTVAIRVMHLGRYGTDAADTRLLPLVWTIGGHRPRLQRSQDWTVVTRHLARLTNARRQWRNTVSDSGLFSHESQFGGLPIEGLAFTDVGRFWTPDRLRGATSLLRRVGTGVRVNAAGMIFELDAVRRFDAARGWTFFLNQPAAWILTCADDCTRHSTNPTTDSLLRAAPSDGFLHKRRRPRKDPQRGEGD